MEIPYSVLLFGLIKDAGMTATDFSKTSIAKELGWNKHRLSDIKNYRYTPTYEKALKGINFFNYQITNNDLLHSLELNRSEVLSRKDSSSAYARVSINLTMSSIYKMSKENFDKIKENLKNNDSEFKPNDYYLNYEQIKVMISDRIKNIYGQNDFSKYVEDLISADIYFGILPGKTEKWIVSAKYDSFAKNYNSFCNSFWM